MSFFIPSSPRPAAKAAILAGALALAACSSGESREGGVGGRGGPKGPITVGYVFVKQGSAPI